MSAGPIGVLVVEDEEIAAAAHAAFVQRVAGFRLVGVARSSVEAIRLLRRHTDIDLVLMDMHLPDGHGLDLVQRLRAEGHQCDVIAVTSARDLDVVKRAVAMGVVLYLLKPFTFAGLRAKLDQYAAYRVQLLAAEQEVVQDEVDQLFGLLRAPGDQGGLPKGMSAETLRLVTDRLRVRHLGPVGHRAGRGLGDLAGDRPALPGAPGRHRPGRPVAALRAQRAPGDGVPVAALTRTSG